MEKYYVILRIGRGVPTELVWMENAGEPAKLTLYPEKAKHVAMRLTDIYGSAFKYEVCQLEPVVPDKGT